MKQKKIYKDIIEKCIAPLLLQFGYTRHKNYFYYSNGDLTYSYDFYVEKMQKREFHFYILASIDSKILNKTINRTNNKLPSAYDNIYSKIIFQSENLKNETKKTERYIKVLLNKIENKLNSITTVSDLVDTCIKENYLVHHEDLFKYLVITTNVLKTKTKVL
jgi:hypothetical protein